MANRNPFQLCSGALFQATSHRKYTTPNIASRIHENGGQAMTIIANANQAATFRDRNSHGFIRQGEIATASGSSNAPK